jgi:hypothetical protein
MKGKRSNVVGVLGETDIVAAEVSGVILIFMV